MKEFRYQVCWGMHPDRKVFANFVNFSEAIAVREALRTDFDIAAWVEGSYGEYEPIGQEETV